MKALVLEEYNKLIYKEVPKPNYSINEVLIQIKACGICGSDVHGMDGSTGRRIPPIIMGHEASGVIVEKGNNVKEWNIGDRVTFDSTVYPLNDWYTLQGWYNLSDNREVMGVSPGPYKRNGAFAEFVSAPEHILYKIPENVSFEQAAMVELVAVALHSINLAGISTGDTCVVVGTGMVGSNIVKLLKLSASNKIIAIDMNAANLLNAEREGADHTFLASDENLREKILALTKGRGADIVFEAVGKSASISTAINIVRKAGKVILVGNSEPIVQVPLQKIVTQELKVLGSCAIRGEYEKVLDMISEGIIELDDQISAVAPLSEGASWFERLKNNKEGLRKVLLVP
jgi:threonine dehydrogenase-like Zn-dependent dehydrogenase